MKNTARIHGMHTFLHVCHYINDNWAGHTSPKKMHICATLLTNNNDTGCNARSFSYHRASQEVISDAMRKARSTSKACQCRHSHIGLTHRSATPESGFIALFMDDVRLHIDKPLDDYATALRDFCIVFFIQVPFKVCVLTGVRASTGLFFST